MTGLHRSLSKLTLLRRNLEEALGKANVHARPAQVTTLNEAKDFGSNPGKLRALLHVPAVLGPRPAMIVALHGCTQTAAVYDAGSGWSELADRAGFIALFPEQQPGNNPNRCFNWFSRQHTQRGQGEVLSIVQMVQHVIKHYDVDPSRVYVAGLSAGGAMTASMLAVYPEVFAGGAIIAGLPHGSAFNVSQALEVMRTGDAKSPRILGDRVRSRFSQHTKWPRVSVWHGTGDHIVSLANGEACASQWVNVHGLAEQPTIEAGNSSHRVRTWLDDRGQNAVELHTLAGMGHGVPLASKGASRCGHAGAFHLDVGVSSSVEILKFFDIDLPAGATEAVLVEPPHSQSHDGPAANDARDSIFDVLHKAGLMNASATGRRQNPPLGQKVHGIIDSALRAAGLIKG